MTMKRWDVKAELMKDGKLWATGKGQVIAETEGDAIEEAKRVFRCPNVTVREAGRLGEVDAA